MAAHDDLAQNVSAIGNVVAGVISLGAIAQAIPWVAALFAFFWYIIQIYECKTARDWRAQRRQKRIAKLKAELIRLDAATRNASSDI